MANKLIAAIKENKNDIRKKLAVAGGIVVASVVAGVVLTKIYNENANIVLVTLEDVTDAATEALSE